MRRMIPVVALSLLLTGCGERQLIVESTTFWEGAITKGDGSILEPRGFGDTTFVSLGSGRICWQFVVNLSLQNSSMRAYMAVPTITGTAERGVDEAKSGNGSLGGEVSGCSDD